jgi:uncharacterized membrane protein YjjB (DUF3815 family)
MQSFIQLLAAGVGSFGYALFFNVRGRDILWASLGGLISWGIYLSSRLIVSSDPLCYFISAFLLTVYAEIMARLRKSPTTVFLVAGTIPLIPGAGLYRTMSAAIAGQFDTAIQDGKTTLLLAAAISSGILLCTVLWHIALRFLFYRRNKARR